MLLKIQNLLCVVCVALAIALMIEGFVHQDIKPLAAALFCIFIVYITINEWGYEQ